MIRSRKMLKRVGDRRHPCFTPTVVLNHSLRLGLSWFNWWVSLLQNFSVAISVSPHVCFILVLILISMFLR